MIITLLKIFGSIIIGWFLFGILFMVWALLMPKGKFDVEI